MSAYDYIKGFHVVFITTWFAGLFYIVRLFIYQAEANAEAEPKRGILLEQLKLMASRLWYIITWPSAIITLILGPLLLFNTGRQWYNNLGNPYGSWLLIKLFFVLGLYLYHFSLHYIFKKHQRNEFPFSSQQLRVWNEVATIFLIAIVMLAVVKAAISLAWGFGVLIGLMMVMMIAIKLYKRVRGK